MLGRRPLARLGALTLTVYLCLAAGALPALGTIPDAPSATSSTIAGVDPAVVAFVPVERFWTPRRDISMAELRAAIEGRHPGLRRVLVAADDPSSLWQALGVTPARTTQTASLARVLKAVRSSKRVLGLVPAAAVRPTVRALPVDGRSLFGRGQLTDLGSWPLLAAPGAAAVPRPFDPALTWTLVAGGDVMLDREVYRQAVMLGKGARYPWNGGFAEIVSRTCCTADGGNAITTRPRGPRGAVRALLSRADLAVVNHEGPAPDDFSYHPGGLVFTFDPALLAGLAGAGIDIVSVANNHIRNAGSRGVIQTIRNLREHGIHPFGAGDDPEHARRPVCLGEHGVRVCLLGYDAINTSVHGVTAQRPGAARLVIGQVTSDIRRARRDGADVVIVMPHWGPEYVTSITPQQRRWARAMVHAGADIVLGAHSHVAGPIEMVDGVPVLYSLGDLLFDLPRFEATEEAFLAELTFQGGRLAQLELHPTVIVDRSQVNLLDPSGDGRVVLKRIHDASKRLHR